MKYYYLTNSKKTNPKCKIIHLDSNLNLESFENMEDNCLVFTDINTNDNTIKWFNNLNYQDNEINNCIKEKKLKLFQVKKLENDTFNIISFIIDLFETRIFELKNRDDKDVNFSKKLKKVNTIMIVGNGPNICSANEIDNNDYVARINSCVIKEEISGKKTNFYYKAGSHGKPDFKNIDFGSSKIFKLTPKGIFHKDSYSWARNKFGNSNLDWSKLFRTLNFKYFKDDPVENFVNKWKIGNAGNTLILFFLKESFNLDLKITVTGFTDYSEYTMWANKKKFSNIPHLNNHYLFPQEQNFTTGYNMNLQNYCKEHNLNNLKNFHDILVSNNIIYKI
jgi:hypothetical protein